MQNKKTLLQRLLVIYITFFIVIVVGVADSCPNFVKGFNQGFEMGDDVVKSWALGTPQMYYVVEDVSLEGMTELPINQTDSANQIKVKGYVNQIGLIVQEPAPDSTMADLAFKSIGGSGWLYLLVMLSMFSFIAIVVLMFLIINSLRRTIKEEGTLEKRNIWLLRIIGLLTIFSELCHSTTNWSMSRKAAELLANTQYTVDTSFHWSYSMMIMGILILFAAEVFAIGHNLSEEQKLTI